MDPWEEEQLAKVSIVAIAELREAMEEGVRRAWFYAKDDANGKRATV
jgi:hypothetical protein